MSFDEELQHPVNVEGSENLLEENLEISSLDGREISLDGKDGKLGPTMGNIGGLLKEKGQEERIWEILNAHRLTHVHQNLKRKTNTSIF